MDPDANDAADDLAAGDRMAAHGVFSRERSAVVPPPEVDREPNYGAVLAMLIHIDPARRAFTQACPTPARNRTAGHASARWLDAAFVAAAGSGGFLTAQLQFGGALAP